MFIQPLFEAACRRAGPPFNHLNKYIDFASLRFAHVLPRRPGATLHPISRSTVKTMGCCATTSPTATPNSGRLTYSTCSCWYAFSSLTFTTAINPLSWHATTKAVQVACVDRLALATHIVCICACSCEAFRNAAWDAPVSTGNIPQVASHTPVLCKVARPQHPRDPVWAYVLTVGCCRLA